MHNDEQHPVDPPPPPQPVEPLSYATAPSPADRHAYARMTWRNDGRLGCLAMFGVSFLLPALYCSAGRYLPHPAVVVAGGAMSVIGLGLYFGLKDGVWGFLAGVGVAVGIIAAVFLLVYSICGGLF